MPKGNSCRPVQPVSASAPCAGRSAMLKRGRAPASRSRWRAATGLFRRYALALLLLVGSVGAPTSALANGTGHVFSVQANQVANEGGRIVFTVEITEADNERYPCFSWEITHGTTDTSDFAPGQALSGMQTIPIFDQT